MMNDLYLENILDHANNPRNYKSEIADASNACDGNIGGGGYICGEGDNPSCGDSGKLCITLSRADNIIEDVCWRGQGCAISQASMSILSEYIKGKSFRELKLLMPGDIYKLLGINITPSRVNCALLSYRAIEKALENRDA